MINIIWKFQKKLIPCRNAQTRSDTGPVIRCYCYSPGELLIVRVCRIHIFLLVSILFILTIRDINNKIKWSLYIWIVWHVQAAPLALENTFFIGIMRRYCFAVEINNAINLVEIIYTWAGTQQLTARLLAKISYRMGEILANDLFDSIDLHRWLDYGLALYCMTYVKTERIGDSGLAWLRREIRRAFGSKWTSKQSNVHSHTYSV